MKDVFLNSIQNFCWNEEITDAHATQFLDLMCQKQKITFKPSALFICDSFYYKRVGRGRHSKETPVLLRFSMLMRVGLCRSEVGSCLDETQVCSLCFTVLPFSPLLSGRAKCCRTPSTLWTIETNHIVPALRRTARITGCAGPIKRLFSAWLCFSLS